MRAKKTSLFFVILALAAATSPAFASRIGVASDHDLTIASNGKSQAIIIVASDAGPNETQAASDLAKYIGLMSGAKPEIAMTPTAIETALSGDRPTIILGTKALSLDPSMKAALSSKLIKHPKLRTDGYILRRQGQRLYAAGNNDLSHYFAVAELLRSWGVRWFIPTNFGECVPEEAELLIGDIDIASSSPFEARTYWTSWLGSTAGEADFQKRNMMTSRAELPPTGHALDQYTVGLGPDTFTFPLTADATANHIADKVEKEFASGANFSLGMADGVYGSDDPADQALLRLQWDKSFLRWSVTDAMLTLYNKIAGRLDARYPNSQSKIGFLAYANMTLPPLQIEKANKRLYTELAPIDIDPIHPMDDARWPERNEFRNILEGWARVIDGRVTIYDYDQSMLLWRDLPNPSHQAFQHDVKAYRDAGLLGVNTETRGAFATTFTNLYLRARLLWNPDDNVERLLDDFFARFYGPAAEPMAAYWRAIFQAWETTIVTEHEYFVAPAIYTKSLLSTLTTQLDEAEHRLRDLAGREPSTLSRNEVLYLKRLKFTQLSFAVLRSYAAMVSAAATQVDYKAAVDAGNEGLKARKALTDMNEVFTSTKMEDGPGFWPGEVQQYAELLAFTHGPKGRLIETLPLEWAFHRDPDRTGTAKGFVDQPIDLSFWSEHRKDYTPATRKDYPADRWETLDTDLYAQAQGIRMPDGRSNIGDV